MDQDDLLKFYLNELKQLHEDAVDFAEKYPEVASQLGLGLKDDIDPQVERLLEGVAYLNGRIQKQIDNEYPEISTALLNVIYPQVLGPLPSMSIVHFDVDTELCADSNHGIDIPRGTDVYANSNNTEIPFKTCFDVKLWPFIVDSIEVESPQTYNFLENRSDIQSILHIKLKNKAKEPSKLNLNTLRFYLNVNSIYMQEVYHTLFHHGVGLVLRAGENAAPVILPSSYISKVGFKPDESLLTTPSMMYHPYNLLIEYFHCRSKFMFLDIHGLDDMNMGSELDIMLLISKEINPSIYAQDTFLLGATPVINLFEQTTDPIRYNDLSYEYLLMADKFNEHKKEIHSIISVHAMTDNQKECQLKPYYSIEHAQQEGVDFFWNIRRSYAKNKRMVGTDCYLSFLKSKRNQTPSFDTFYAKTWCTSRYLASNYSLGKAKFYTSYDLPIKSIKCLKNPTEQHQFNLSGEAQWRFISTLSFNFLNLLQGSDGVMLLKELLGSFNFIESNAIKKEIAGIKHIETASVVRCITSGNFRGFCKGTRVTIVFDKNFYNSDLPIMFANILDCFMSQLMPINTFIELGITNDINMSPENIVYYKPHVGERELL